MIVNVKKGLIVACGLLILAAGCGRRHQPNARPGDELVFRRTAAASPGVGPGASSRPRENEVLSEGEFARRAMVRQIEKLFRDAKSSDDRFDPLEKIQQQNIYAPELLPYVARCLADPDPDQRGSAVKARVIISPKDAISDLKLVLRDSDPKVRQAAVEAFGLLPDPLPFDVLFERVGSEQDPVVQQAIMLIFARRGNDAVLARVLPSVQELDLKAVGPLIDLARKFPATARPHADALAYFLDRNDADLRMQVAKLLGEWSVRTPAVVTGLVRALDDSELSVRKAAINALKSFSSQDFGYNPEVEPGARKEAIARWRAWAKQASGGARPVDGPESAPASR
jgi:HEAT repeats/HEAT repeat associated with sister chromatid cohesion